MKLPILPSKIEDFRVDAGVIYILSDNKIYKKYPYSPTYELVAEGVKEKVTPSFNKRKSLKSVLTALFDK